MSVLFFLSSTFRDLHDYRQVALDAFRQLRVLNRIDVDIAAMEDFAFASQRPIDFIENKIMPDCAGYLGILGNERGSIVPGRDKSFVECEYERAVGLGMTIYMVDCHDSDPSLGERQSAFLQEVQKQHTILRAPSVDKLRAALATHLSIAIIRDFPHLVPKQAGVTFWPRPLPPAWEKNAGAQGLAVGDADGLQEEIRNAARDLADKEATLNRSRDVGPDKREQILRPMRERVAVARAALERLSLSQQPPS